MSLYMRSSTGVARCIVGSNRAYRCAQRNFSSGGAKVGFIGLGNMGYSMAKNIALADTNAFAKDKVVVYDLNAQQAGQLVKECAESNAPTPVTVAASVQEVAKQCNIIITMLPATKHVEGVLLGPEGVIETVCDGALLVDCSTIDPLASQALHRAAAEQGRGLHILDAPVSGGVTGAAAGTLTFMVGGTEASLASAESVLKAMGKNIVHCGDAGAGGIAKLCNNMALAIGMIGTSEAMALGLRLGMDPQKLANVMNTSTARCWSSDSYNPVPGISPNAPANRDYAGGFGVGLMEKDLGLAVQLATQMRARTPLGTSAHQLYGMLSDHGYIGKDFSVVFKFLSEQQDK